jgi:hypothetical protein
MDETYFTFSPTADNTEYYVVDHGPTEQLGSYARGGDFVYYGTDIIATPGDLPVRVVDEDYLLVGQACFSSGRYRVDVRDPLAEDREIRRQCRRQQNQFLYDGLQIGFAAQLFGLGSLDSNPAKTVYELGKLTITNTSDEVRDLPAAFLEGFALRVIGRRIAPPDDAWPSEGVMLAAGESYSWTLKTSTVADPLSWVWTLEMEHSAKRAHVFHDKIDHIGGGLLSVRD